MIRKFIEDIEKVIRASPIILSSDIQNYFDPFGEFVYFKSHIIFIETSILALAIFAIESNDILIIDKYRFHYMSSREEMLFRYDNAPHHPGTETHPHHKHVPGKIISDSNGLCGNIIY